MNHEDMFTHDARLDDAAKLLVDWIAEADTETARMPSSNGWGDLLTLYRTLPRALDPFE